MIVKKNFAADSGTRSGRFATNFGKCLPHQINLIIIIKVSGVNSNKITGMPFAYK